MVESAKVSRDVRLTAVAQVTGVVLRLVVDPHVVGDVSGRQQLPTDVTRYLLLVPDQVGAETVPRGERRRARLCKRDDVHGQRDEHRKYKVKTCEQQQTHTVRMDDDSNLQGLGSFLNHDVIYDDSSELTHMIVIIFYIVLIIQYYTHRQAVLMLCFYFIYV